MHESQGLFSAEFSNTRVKLHQDKETTYEHVHGGWMSLVQQQQGIMWITACSRHRRGDENHDIDILQDLYVACIAHEAEHSVEQGQIYART